MTDVFNVDLSSITNIPSSPFDIANKVGSNPVILIFLIGIIIVYYFVFSSLGTPGMEPMSSSATSSGLTGLEVLLWGLFVVLILMNGLQYFFNVDLKASIQNLFTETPQIDLTVTKTVEDTPEQEEEDGPLPNVAPPLAENNPPQVYHISDNIYNYKNAKAICESLNAKLATYDQIEDAYKHGAQWCSYGWSEGQMAYFPTQKDTFNKLQTIDGHKNDCGRPGINGGYIGNPYAEFGVNCYGPKPDMSAEEGQLMMNAPLYPKTQKELNFEKRVKYWRNKADTLRVAPFSKEKWSGY